MFKQMLKNSTPYPKIRRIFISGIPDNGRILEIGCGDGGNLKAVHSLKSEIELFGVDIEESNSLPKDVNFLKVDLNHGTLPYADNYFDAVFFVHVIEHLNPNFETLGREINRVLKPEGRIYVETPNWTSALVPSFGFMRNQSFAFNFYDDPTHVRPYTKMAIHLFISANCNLRNVSVETMREKRRLLLDLVRIPLSILAKDRISLLGSFCNLYGWNIYGIGKK